MNFRQKAGVSTTTVFLAGMFIWVAPVAAQDYPEKPVRIVASGPGTTTDYLARFLGQRLSGRWGQSVVVDNRGGGAGTISPSLVAAAAPDGYTLLMGEASGLSNAIHLQKTTYDSLRDFAPITLVARSPLVIVAHPAVPAGNLREFIVYAKNHPRAMSYAAAGPSSVSSLTSGLLCLVAGIDLVQIPYRGANAALSAVISGEAQFGSVAATLAVPQVLARKVKAYAVTSQSRFTALPDVPTGIEAGLPGFESLAWFGIVAPARAPVGVITKVNRDVVDILRAPETVANLQARGTEAAPTTPAEFAAFIRAEIPKWGKVIKATGARAY